MNRALCHKKRSDWPSVKVDAEAALSLNGGLVKGHYLLGFSLVEMEGDLQKATGHLTKALELAREQNDGIKVHRPHPHLLCPLPVRAQPAAMPPPFTRMTYGACWRGQSSPCGRSLRVSRGRGWTALGCGLRSRLSPVLSS